MLRHFHFVSQCNCMKTIRNSRTNCQFPFQFLIFNCLARVKAKGEIPPFFFGRPLKAMGSCSGLGILGFTFPLRFFLLSRDKRLLGLGGKG